MELVNTDIQCQCLQQILHQKIEAFGFKGIL